MQIDGYYKYVNFWRIEINGLIITCCCYLSKAYGASSHEFVIKKNFSILALEVSFGFTNLLYKPLLVFSNISSCVVHWIRVIVLHEVFQVYFYNQDLQEWHLDGTSSIVVLLMMTIAIIMVVVKIDMTPDLIMLPEAMTKFLGNQ